MKKKPIARLSTEPTEAELMDAELAGRIIDEVFEPNIGVTEIDPELRARMEEDLKAIISDYK